MAEVWYAENRIHKAAAVKLLNDDLSRNATIVERFENEAEIMVKLDHDNIRQVYDFGELDGRPAIIMEYLEGDDLKARMKHGQRFTDEELIKWWNQLVDALNYTHKKGIIHRDIKPGNIFVDTEGNIKLLDFGIAKVRESISATQTGQKLGTLMYMSPEQVRDSKHIDYHTDNYSLAVTFVHLLTGKKPYDSDTSSDFDIQLSIVTKPLDMNEVPEKWRGFLAQYLEKEPAQRAELKPFEAISSKNEAEPVAEKPASTSIKHESDETIVDIPVEPKKEIREEKPTKDNLQQEELPKEEQPKTNEIKKKVGIWLGLMTVFMGLLMFSNKLFYETHDIHRLCDNYVFYDGVKSPHGLDFFLHLHDLFGGSLNLFLNGLFNLVLLGVLFLVIYGIFYKLKQRKPNVDRIAAIVIIVLNTAIFIYPVFYVVYYGIALMALAVLFLIKPEKFKMLPYLVVLIMIVFFHFFTFYRMLMHYDYGLWEFYRYNYLYHPWSDITGHSLQLFSSIPVVALLIVMIVRKVKAKKAAKTV